MVFEHTYLSSCIIAREQLANHSKKTNTNFVHFLRVTDSEIVINLGTKEAGDEPPSVKRYC